MIREAGAGHPVTIYRRFSPQLGLIYFFYDFLDVIVLLGVEVLFVVADAAQLVDVAADEDEHALQLRDHVVPQTARAVAGSLAKGTHEIRLQGTVLQVYVIVLLQARATVPSQADEVVPLLDVLHAPRLLRLLRRSAHLHCKFANTIGKIRCATKTH